MYPFSFRKVTDRYFDILCNGEKVSYMQGVPEESVANIVNGFNQAFQLGYQKGKGAHD